ncbi:MAG: MAPEG family protein [Myxococcota bacterium]
MPVPVTAMYTGLLALVGLALQQGVGRERLRSGVSLGDGGQPALVVAMRRQANFVEQVPLALLLLAIIELGGAPSAWLHTLGATLLVARIVHPFGLEYERMRRVPRLVGAVGTLLVVLGAALTAIWQGVNA